MERVRWPLDPAAPPAAPDSVNPFITSSPTAQDQPDTPRSTSSNSAAPTQRTTVIDMDPAEDAPDDSAGTAQPQHRAAAAVFTSAPAYSTRAVPTVTVHQLAFGAAQSQSPTRGPPGPSRAKLANTANTPSAKQPSQHADAATGAVVSPFSNRFRVPPPAASPSSSPSAPHAMRQRSPGEETAGTTPAQRRAQHTESYVRSSADADEDGEDEVDVDSDDVAARVLDSLHQKDSTIEELTRTVAALQARNAALQRQREELETLHGINGGGSPMRGGTPSPSWPVTPVRWWKTDPADAATATAPGTAPALTAAHAAVTTVAALQQALEEKAVELADVQGRLERADVLNAELQQQQQQQLITQSPADGDTRIDAHIQSAQARIAQLEWQLEALQQDKREDAGALRDHIDHLSREVRHKSRELARQSRQHKLELAAVQEEVAGLAQELERQLHASAAASSSSAAQQQLQSHAATAAAQVEDMRRQLAQAKAQEALLVSERAATQRRWQREMEAQKRLLDEAATAEAEKEAHLRAERVAWQHAARQQRQQCEAEAQQCKAALAVAQRETAELRAVHRRTEEAVAEQRVQLQSVSCDLATAVLEREHEAQRAAHAADELALLRRRLAQAESVIAAQADELEGARQAREADAATAAAQQEAEQTALLQHVQGCMQGSEAMEKALLQAETSRRETAAQLTRALTERDEYHRLLREAAVQTQAQLLEQQQLLSDGHELVCRRLHEVQQALAVRTDALAAAQHELEAVQPRLEALRSDLAGAADTRERLEADLRAAQSCFDNQTEQLVRTTEAVKAALQAQLQATRKLQRSERQRRALQAEAQRARERRQQEQEALHSIVELLWPTSDNSIHAVLGGDGGGGGGSGGAVMRTTAWWSRALAALPAPHVLSSPSSRLAHEHSNISEAAPPAAPPPPPPPRAHVDDTGGAAAVDFTLSPSRSSAELSSSPSTASDAAATDETLSDEDGAAERSRDAKRRMHRYRHHATRAPSSRHATAARPDAGREDEEVRGASSTRASELPVLRALHAIHTAVTQLSAAYTHAAREVESKRTAVRTLVAERKTLQAQLEAQRAASEEQRTKAERQRREAQEALRAESQAALDAVDAAWRERYEAGLARQREAADDTQRRAVACALELCAAQTTAELTHLVELLPHTVGDGLVRAADAVEELHVQAALEREAAHQRDLAALEERLWHAQQYSTIAAHPLNAFAAAPSAANEIALELDVQPELQAECDAISRAVLGMPGGWEDLKGVVLAASVSSAAPTATAAELQAGGVPPEQPSPAHAPPAAPSLTPATVRWSAEELADVAEVITAYLTQTWRAVAEASASDTSATKPAAAVTPSTTAQALPRWMASKPPPQGGRQPHLLANLLDACVVHVQERLLS